MFYCIDCIELEQETLTKTNITGCNPFLLITKVSNKLATEITWACPLCTAFLSMISSITFCSSVCDQHNNEISDFYILSSTALS